MIILRDISLVCSLLHTLVLFYILFEPRFPAKKSNTIIFSTMIPLILLNIAFFYYVGASSYGMLLLLTLSLPSLGVFWYLAKNRDGRFLFTFCIVDTIVLEILYVTQIVDHFVSKGTYIFMFAVRLVIFPVIEYLLYKKVRRIYLDIQEHTKKGWYLFAAISAIFYILMSLMINSPVPVIERPEYLPQAILLLILIPIVYLHIFNTLIRQKKMYEMEEQENILKLQTANMKARIEEFSSADKKFSIERHDIRHKLQTIAVLAENGENEKLIEFVNECTEAIGKTSVKHYCLNTVLDAVFSSYIRTAERKNIKVTTSIELPVDIGINESDFATMLANAIENAVNAAEKLPEEERYIDIKVLDSPMLMLQISNGFDGNIELDENGIPLNAKEGHGFGIRSIIAFCEKYGAFYEFKVSEKDFILRIILN